MNITIIDDAKAEATEQFTIELSTDDTKVEFVRKNATIEISDSDSKNNIIHTHPCNVLHVCITFNISLSISHKSIFSKLQCIYSPKPLSLPSHPLGVEVSLQLAMYTVDETVGTFEVCVEVEPGVLHTRARVTLMSHDLPPGTPREHSAVETGTLVTTIDTMHRSQLEYLFNGLINK